MNIIFKKIFRKLHIWKYVFNKIGTENFIARTIILSNPENISIGNNCVINEYVLLNAREKISIGDFVHISSFSMIHTSGLDYKKTMEEREHFERPVIIEDGVWIGAGAIINPGVTIGKNSVVGAGAVVTSNISENSVAVGVPAKVIKKIN
ncbi:MAG: acyltransferase [Patescibacteria group bacterium]|nr:acyltransferase [Patescibacteria group bacterium]